MTELQVAEYFFTVQGEGPYAGTPAVFLRLAGCNLRCGAVGRELDDVDPVEDEPTEGASWICDTIPEWKQADVEVTPEDMVTVFREEGHLEEIRDKGAHIVLTGGEPTLPVHQVACQEFLVELQSAGVDPFVEVETNGTIEPRGEYAPFIDQFNVSLKLSNSGHDESRRIDEDALNWHKNSPRSTFKFVVSTEEDVNEVLSLISDYGIKNRDVMLMPAGQTREQLQDTYSDVMELCMRYGFRFSPRTHVTAYNEQTGV
jgi:organic radical activating enzyme